MNVLVNGFDIIIDSFNLDIINSHKWKTVRNCGIYGPYFYCLVNNKILYLHRLIARCSDSSIDVDHIDRNPLNNKVSNLRQVKHGDNLLNRGKQINNTTGYKGVTHARNKNIYVAKIGYKGHYINICQSTNKEYCARMYDIFAIVLHKEHAFTNFPLESYNMTDVVYTYNATIRAKEERRAKYGIG
jgi:hypothetical protein